VQNKFHKLTNNFRPKMNKAALKSKLQKFESQMTQKILQFKGHPLE